jgi:hypothetical protein
VTKDQQLHNDCIARAYPKFADVPFAESIKPPQVRRGSIRHKLRSTVDVMRITSALGASARPHRRVFLGGPVQLRRLQDTALRLHALCLSGLDAARARRLLDLAGRLQDSRPRRLISDAI